MNYWPVFVIAALILIFIWSTDFWSKKMRPKHSKKVVKYYGSLEELAVDVADLDYKFLQVFLKELSDKLERDAKADADSNRSKLALELHNASIEVKYAAHSIEKAAVICESYMKK